MSDSSTAPRPGTYRNGSPDSPEVSELREEVMRLRDLLIARDAELGQARGRLEQLEARTTRLLGAAAWLRRFGPPFAQLRATLRGRD